MFCTNCDNKIVGSQKFCIRCGIAVPPEIGMKLEDSSRYDKKWWLRIVKVLYILFYLPLPFVAFFVWDAKKLHDCGFTRVVYCGLTQEAFWYTTLTVAIWIIVLRVLKIIFHYIVFGVKPSWKTEFKKLY